MSEEGRILVEGGPVHRRVQHLFAVVIGLMIGLAVVVGALIFLNHQQGVTNCRQIEKLKLSVRSIFLEAQYLSSHSTGITAQQRAEAVVFYRDALGKLEAKKC